MQSVLNDPKVFLLNWVLTSFLTNVVSIVRRFSKTFLIFSPDLLFLRVWKIKKCIFIKKVKYRWKVCPRVILFASIHTAGKLIARFWGALNLSLNFVPYLVFSNLQYFHHQAGYQQSIKLLGRYQQIWSISQIGWVKKNAGSGTRTQIIHACRVRVTYEL